MAANRGFVVTVVADAMGTHKRELDGDRFGADLVHQTALAGVAGEFAAVVESDALL